MLKNSRMAKTKNNFVAGARTWVSHVRVEYPNQLDYNGCLSGIGDAMCGGGGLIAVSRDG
jgi:hypothetical protein